MNAGEMIHYTEVEQMAEAYRTATARIAEAMRTIDTETDRLYSAFAEDTRYDFDIGLHFRGDRHSSAEQILVGIKRTCWKKIIEKLNIRRLMSSQRVKELDRALSGESQGYDSDSGRQLGPFEWPDITPETIQSVAAGYLASATEFLEEAVAEEYDFWRPRTEHKTNAQFWKLARKVIKPYVVEPAYRSGSFRLTYSYDRAAHVTALDNIMHMLDGQGPVKEYKGELGSAIEMSEDGRGETKYFRFKCFKNGNLHLEFKRQDLLDRFNEIAAKRDRLPGHRRSA
jgi:hypothetical protein